MTLDLLTDGRRTSTLDLADGTNTRIEFGSPKAWQSYTGAQTVFIRFRLDQLGSVTGLSQYLWSETSSTEVGERVLVNNANGISFGFNSSGATSSPQAQTNDGVLDTALGVWKDFAGTFAGGLSASGIVLYLANSGAPLVQQAIGATADGVTALSHISGGEYTLFDRNLTLGARTVKGSMLFVRWSRVLTTAELRAVQTHGPLSVRAGMMECWIDGENHSPYQWNPRRSVRVGITRAPLPHFNQQSIMAVADYTATPPTSYTVTGPSGGLANTTSTAFTVTLNNPAVTTVNVSFTSSDAGDVFRNNADTSTITSVAITAGNTTALFKILPDSTAGGRTITFSDDAGLTDQTPLTYTVSAGTTFWNDSFTDTNGTLPHAHRAESGQRYFQMPYYTGTLIDITNNRVRNTGPADSSGSIGFRTNIAPQNEDHTVTSTWYVNSSNDRPFAHKLRVSPSAQTWYWVYGLVASGVVRVYRVVAGVVTQLGSDIAQTFTTTQSYSIKSRIYGQGATVTIEVSVNGGAVTTFTDTDASRIVASDPPGYFLGGGTGAQLDSITAVDANTSDVVAHADLRSNQVLQRSGTSLSVTVAGVYNGNVTSVQARIVQHGTSTEVVTWTTVAGSVSAGVFTGTISVPQGGPYNLQVRAGNNTLLTSNGTNAFYVGALISVTGQSNGYQLFTVGSGSPTSTTKSYQLYAWGGNTGAGSIAIGNALASALGVPIGMVCNGVNGAALTSGGAGPYGYWLDTVGTPYTQWLIDTATNDGKYEAMVWVQGENDAQLAVAGATYAAGLVTMFGRFRTLLGQSSLPIVMSTLGRATDGTSTDASWQAISDAQLAAESISNVYVVGGTKLLSMADTLHYDATGYLGLGTALSRGVRKALGETIEYKGPFIASALLVSSTVIDVTLTHRSGTDFTPTSGVTGFSVTDGGTPVTISTVARQNATTIRITLSAPLVGAANVRYLYGKNPTISSAVKDNNANTFALEQDSSTPATADMTMVLGAGSYSMTGGGGINMNATMVLGSGAFVLTGGNLNFNYVPPEGLAYTMALDSGSFLFEGGAMVFTLSTPVIYNQRPPRSRVIIVGA